MAIFTTKWILVTIIYVAMKTELILIIQAQQPQVPCLFFFGDSLVDNGNNNMLLTIVKANYRPNGIDYPRGIPTGRFSNGRNLADFLGNLFIYLFFSLS